MSQFEDRFWSSRDGLRLHYRIYGGAPGPSAAGRLPVICLPGLTRNARDFEDLAPHLAQHRTVLCPDMRGRGDSAYAKDSGTYNPLQYVEDLQALLGEAGIGRFIAIGTSLGGLMAMLLALSDGQRVAGTVLNDIGPVIEPDGLARIRDYVGSGRSFPTWMHAARALEETHGEAFPAREVTDWLRMAKRVMALGQNGRIAFDYDMKIAEPFAQSGDGPAPDLWPGFAALANGPMLVLRGAFSDLLSEATAREMAARNPAAEMVTIANCGHAPSLDEPEARAAIDRLIARCD
jgi:pimeloyl-ACP methyl ester carboxylesterase